MRPRIVPHISPQSGLGFKHGNKLEEIQQSIDPSGRVESGLRPRMESIERPLHWLMKNQIVFLGKQKGISSLPSPRSCTTGAQEAGSMAVESLIGVMVYVRFGSCFKRPSTGAFSTGCLGLMHRIGCTLASSIDENFWLGGGGVEQRLDLPDHKVDLVLQRSSLSTLELKKTASMIQPS